MDPMGLFADISQPNNASPSSNKCVCFDLQTSSANCKAWWFGAFIRGPLIKGIGILSDTLIGIPNHLDPNHQLYKLHHSERIDGEASHSQVRWRFAIRSYNQPRLMGVAG